ncbi:endonuclease/exonuclease/phosphatase family protein [Thalassobacillus devorans]|uniref:endonuclease/exonuclease/phosphatase family protein n=1 Tax=Thalassobacillus devorans TaxID=279813 RepID=UPI0020CB188F|nr:endonuclease/exonuclease/phosphatase family protein [Thalassobacillus devorans]
MRKKTSGKSLQLFIMFMLVLGAMLPVTAAPAAAATSGNSEMDLDVMTFNLRYLNDHDPSPHTWEERHPTVRQVIRMEQPDIIGTQEAVYQQVKDVDQDLPGYEWIGMGREGGNQGEFMAIYYKKNRFTPTEYDHYWLSDTPDVVGSTSWGNSIPRMVTWVKFLDEKTNQSFYFVNTHFDHQSEEARQKSANLVVEKMKEFDPDLPVLVTGDFNASPNSIPYQNMTEDTPIVDLYHTAGTVINENLGTFNGFDDPTGGGPDSRIDWILATENVTANHYEIINYQKNGQYPSDHYPVSAEVTLHY